MESAFDTIWSIFGKNLVLPFFLWTVVGLFAGWIGFKAFAWTSELRESAKVNIGVLLVNAACGPLIYFLVEPIGSLYASLGIPSVPAQAWAGVFVLLPALASVFLTDFVNYWHHRLMHTKWYWPVHSVHHTETDINFTTVFRVHLLEVFAMQVSFLLLASWLGVPPLAAVIASLINTIGGQYQHLGLPISHGKLGDKIISSPQVHQWHHANHPEAYGKNLANFFTFLDVAFGTYYNPGPCDKPLGVTDGPDQDLVGNLMFPFTEWKRIYKESRGEQLPAQPETDLTSQTA